MPPICTLLGGRTWVFLRGDGGGGLIPQCTLWKLVDTSLLLIITLLSTFGERKFA